MKVIKSKPLLFMLIGSAIILFLFLLMQPLLILHFHEKIAILFPKGEIAIEQRNLMLVIQVIMLLVIIPVYIFTFIFSWRYRARNNNTRYDPDLVDNTIAEVIWWSVPLIFTAIIAVLTWIKTYELDPFKPLVSDKKPMTIQVVALQWKWLFLYPEENIATVNFVQFPVDKPIHFEITADAPMNSFWIPHLGGQIYAMPAMQTELHLIANEAGDFPGASANLSGEGFAGMHFVTRASSQEEYDHWLQKAKQSPDALNWTEYRKLAAPSQNNPVAIYRLQDPHLFHKIMDKFMHPQKT